MADKNVLDRFTVGVVVFRRPRSWAFTAYVSESEYDCDPKICNIMRVHARNKTDAKAKAIATIKARMDLKSQLVPTGIQICNDP